MPTTTAEVKVGDRVRIIADPVSAAYSARGHMGTVSSVPDADGDSWDSQRYRIMLDEPVPSGANNIQTVPRGDFEVVAEIKVGDRVRVGENPTTTSGGYVNANAAGKVGTVVRVDCGMSQREVYVRFDEMLGADRGHSSDDHQYIDPKFLTVVQELKVGDKVRVAEEAGTRPRNDPYGSGADRWGFVSPLVRGHEGEITHAQGQLFRVQVGESSQLVHPDFLTKVEGQPKAEEFKIGDRVRVDRRRSGSTSHGVVMRYRDLEFARRDGSTSDDLVVKYDADGGYDFVRALTADNGYTLTKVEEQLADWEKELLGVSTTPAEPKAGDRVRLTDAGRRYYSEGLWAGEELKIFRIEGSSYGIGPVDHRDYAHDSDRGWLMFHRRDLFEVVASAPAPAAPADTPAPDVAKAVEEALDAYKIRVRETALRFGRSNGIDMDPLEDLLEEMGLNKLPKPERKIRRRVTVTFDLEATLSEDADTDSFDANEMEFLDDSMDVHDLDLGDILDGDWNDVQITRRSVSHTAL